MYVRMAFSAQRSELAWSLVSNMFVRVVMNNQPLLTAAFLTVEPGSFDGKVSFDVPLRSTEPHVVRIGPTMS
jgi:hypothetical protein